MGTYCVQRWANISLKHTEDFKEGVAENSKWKSEKKKECKELNFSQQKKKEKRLAKPIVQF